MWFIVKPKCPFEFMTFDSRHSIKVDGIEIGSPGTIFRLGKAYPRNDAILNGAQAISILNQAGVPSFPTKTAAKEKAMAIGLKTWKYLQISELKPQYSKV